VDDTVDATGTINAVTTVQVGAQVSGAISKLYADFNSTVHQGDLLAVIDPRVYEGQLLQAQANVANAQANLAATIANLANAQAKAVQSKADYERASDLTKQGIMSPQSFDAAKATSVSADAQVTADKALELQAQAQVAQQEAALKVSETNLAYTKIYAPIDGTVINRAVDVGQTVTSGFTTPTLFTIAKDLTKMQLHISTDEGDIGAVKVGAPVIFRVDAFPGQKFDGLISQVRMNATTVQNVVTYETIVDFDNPDRKLFPGMTAYATIPVQSVKDALTVPNSAIRYNPDMSQAEVAALLNKYGVEISGGPAPNANSSSAGATAVKRTTTALVWKLRADKSIEPVLIETGVTDHSSTAVTQVLKGTIAPGDAIVTSEQAKPAGFGR
jgi:HlyD family secretion protein